ncbi:MAG: branched-chain amino acid ABC transporter permease [Lachnospiraceae bacterium]|nr:branched-chain amino acid ABC transporter permease [Lachnospiraceae bacterium]
MKKISESTRSSFINYSIILVFFLVFQCLLSMGKLSSSFSGQLIPICAYIVMALSLNLVVGISGELSLGHAGFMSVGAFSGVVVATSLQGTVEASPLRLLIAMVMGALIAALAGTIIGIPVLRLRGDYLAIVTLAFGEIIKNVLNCLYVGVDNHGLHFSMKDANAMGMEADGTVIINGPMGALGIQKLSTFVSGILLVFVVLFVIQNLVNSRSGRAVQAIRDNRIAAESCGLNITKYKLMAFVTSAAMAGAAGALYALNYSTVVPKKFDFNTSILILVFVVLGGIGNLRGSIIAAAVLTVLPEMLRQFQDYRMLVYAIVLILIMICTNNQKAKEILAKFGSVFSRKKVAEEDK